MNDIFGDLHRFAERHGATHFQDWRAGEQGLLAYFPEPDPDSVATHRVTWILWDVNGCRLGCTVSAVDLVPTSVYYRRRVLQLRPAA